jgi:hypothetical protein
MLARRIEKALLVGSLQSILVCKSTHRPNLCVTFSLGAKAFSHRGACFMKLRAGRSGQSRKRGLNARWNEKSTYGCAPAHILAFVKRLPVPGNPKVCHGWNEKWRVHVCVSDFP